jgi:hypothetical protein
MEDNTYNGWTNYATWRVNLEFFDDGAAEHYQDAQSCREYVESVIEDQAQGIALDYALAFLSEVNWHEIAKQYEEFDETRETIEN